MWGWGGGGGSKIERVEEREGGKDLRRRELERAERKQEGGRKKDGGQVGGKESQERERELRTQNFITQGLRF